jgi:Restriction endonuclease S subunits
MEGWEETTLATVADIIPGFAFKGGDFGDKGEIIIKIKDISPPIINIKEAERIEIGKYSGKDFSKYRLHKGDFVIAMTGATIGKVGRLTSDCVAFINQRVAKISPHSDVCFDFVYHAIRSPEFDQFIQNNIDSHSAQENISGASIGRFPILIPRSLTEQRAIAGVLSSLDDKIDLLHRQNKTLESLAETLFRQWFVEEAEDDWEDGALSDLVRVLSGYPFKSSTFEESGRFRLVTIKAVQNGALELANASAITDLPNKLPSYCKLQIGDILMSLTGNVGRCCLVDTEDLLLNQRVAKLEPINSNDWAYIYTYFRSQLVRRELEEMAKGTAQPNLSPIEISKNEIKIPPKIKRTEFGDFANVHIEKLLQNLIQIQTLEVLRDTLLPKLMSGEVRVEVDRG